MAQWTNININKNMVVTETERSILINMPSTSEYSGYSFWHLKKLVRNGRHKGAINIGFTQDFIFYLKKYGNGKYNKFDVLDEIEINSKEFEKQFEKMDANIVERGGVL